MTPLYALYKRIKRSLSLPKANVGTRPRIEESVEISSTQSNPSISSVGRGLGSRYE